MMMKEKTRAHTQKDRKERDGSLLFFLLKRIIFLSKVVLKELSKIRSIDFMDVLDPLCHYKKSMVDGHALKVR